jgi:hypothetical protein
MGTAVDNHSDAVIFFSVPGMPHRRPTTGASARCSPFHRPCKSSGSRFGGSLPGVLILPSRVSPMTAFAPRLSPLRMGLTHTAPVVQRILTSFIFSRLLAPAGLCGGRPHRGIIPYSLFGYYSMRKCFCHFHGIQLRFFPEIITFCVVKGTSWIHRRYLADQN